MKKSRVGRIWEIRKRVIGGERKSIEQTAIVDPETGKLLGQERKLKRLLLNTVKQYLGKT